MTKAHPRSTEQTLREQKVTAERDRAVAQRQVAQQKQAEPLDLFARPGGQPQQAVVSTVKATIALPDTRTPHQAYLDAIAPSGIVGRLLKFGKSGTFVTADTDEKIDAEQPFVALCDQVLIGYQKFQDDAPPIRHMGLLYGSPPFTMPIRETLGDNDPSKWPLGLDGQPADVWQHTIFLPLQKGDASAEMFTFSTSSRTGRRSVGALLRHYDRLMRTHPDMYPCVKLRASGFQHRDERIGWVAVPAFAVCGRQPKDSAAIPDTSLRADLDDEIPTL
jgi:hypothetical protein